jgi:hypothetical protein
MKILFFVLLTFFAIVGISHIIFEIFYRFFKNEDDNTFLLIIPKENNFDIEFAVRSAVAKMKKLGKNGGTDIILLDDKLSAQQKKELDILRRDFSYLKIMSSEDFKEKTGL